MGIQLPRRLASGQRLEGLRRDEALGLGCQDRRDFMPGLDQQARELGRLVGRDSAGDAEQDPCHGQHSALRTQEDRRLKAGTDPERGLSQQPSLGKSPFGDSPSCC